MLACILKLADKYFIEAPTQRFLICENQKSNSQIIVVKVFANFSSAKITQPITNQITQKGKRKPIGHLKPPEKIFYPIT